MIGGDTHAGKTYLSQKLMEKYLIPYTSIDHIKMGIIRGIENCGFNAESPDEIITEKLWEIIKGIIITCLENKQNIILEGCYLPPEYVKNISNEEVIPLYIILSQDYINKNFDKILQYENIIESRLCSEQSLMSDMLENNSKLKSECIKYNMPYFEIIYNYEEDIKQLYSYFDKQYKLLKEK